MRDHIFIYLTRPESIRGLNSAMDPSVSFTQGWFSFSTGFPTSSDSIFFGPCSRNFFMITASFLILYIFVKTTTIWVHSECFLQCLSTASVLVSQFGENMVQVTSSTGECQLGSQLQLVWLLLDSYSFTFFTYVWTVIVLHTFRKLGNLYLPLCTLGWIVIVYPFTFWDKNTFAHLYSYTPMEFFLCYKFFQLHPKKYEAVLGCNKDCESTL